MQSVHRASAAACPSEQWDNSRRRAQSTAAAAPYDTGAAPLATVAVLDTEGARELATSGLLRPVHGYCKGLQGHAHMPTLRLTQRGTGTQARQHTSTASTPAPTPPVRLRSAAPAAAPAASSDSSQPWPACRTQHQQDGRRGLSRAHQLSELHGMLCRPCKELKNSEGAMRRLSCMLCTCAHLPIHPANRGMPAPARACRLSHAVARQGGSCTGVGRCTPLKPIRCIPT